MRPRPWPDHHVAVGRPPALACRSTGASTPLIASTSAVATVMPANTAVVSKFWREDWLACVLHREADLERHLKMLDLAVFDMPTRPRDLEPAQIPNRLVGAFDRHPDGVVDAFFRCTDQFDHPIDMTVHIGLRTSGSNVVP